MAGLNLDNISKMVNPNQRPGNNPLVMARVAQEFTKSAKKKKKKKNDNDSTETSESESSTPTAGSRSTAFTQAAGTSAPAKPEVSYGDLRSAMAKGPKKKVTKKAVKQTTVLFSNPDEPTT
jgi:hypothetical protein